MFRKWMAGILAAAFVAAVVAAPATGQYVRQYKITPTTGNQQVVS